jgi:hypothetical protein
VEVLFQYINGLEERIDFSEIGMEVRREETIYVSGILISLEEDKNPILKLSKKPLYLKGIHHRQILKGHNLLP